MTCPVCREAYRRVLFNETGVFVYVCRCSGPEFEGRSSKAGVRRPQLSLFDKEPK